MKVYTEDEINEAAELFSDFHSDKSELVPYLNRETDEDGNVVSFYIGLEDSSGRAVTGYDEHYPER